MTHYIARCIKLSLTQLIELGFIKSQTMQGKSTLSNMLFTGVFNIKFEGYKHSPQGFQHKQAVLMGVEVEKVKSFQYSQQSFQHACGITRGNN